MTVCVPYCLCRSPHFCVIESNYWCIDDLMRPSKGHLEHWRQINVESGEEVEPTIRANTAAATLENEWHHTLQVSGLGSAPSAILQIFGLLQILGRLIPAGSWEQNGWRWTLLWLRGFRAGFEDLCSHSARVILCEQQMVTWSLCALIHLCRKQTTILYLLCI